MISVNDKIPSLEIKTFDDNGPTAITTDTIFSGKKVVLFAVPGAFTPTCSAAHLPGFVVNHSHSTVHCRLFVGRFV